MRVILNGPSGSFQLLNFEEHMNRIEKEYGKAPALVTYSGRFYEYAGTQDGAHFYKERT